MARECKQNQRIHSIIIQFQMQYLVSQSFFCPNSLNPNVCDFIMTMSSPSPAGRAQAQGALESETNFLTRHRSFLHRQAAKLAAHAYSFSYCFTSSNNSTMLPVFKIIQIKSIFNITFCGKGPIVWSFSFAPKSVRNIN